MRMKVVNRMWRGRNCRGSSCWVFEGSRVDYAEEDMERLVDTVEEVGMENRSGRSNTYLSIVVSSCFF